MPENSWALRLRELEKTQPVPIEKIQELYDEIVDRIMEHEHDLTARAALAQIKRRYGNRIRTYAF